MFDFLIENPKYIWAFFSILVFITIVASFIKAHFSENTEFDVMKLVMYDQDGKLSDSKARLNGAFGITSWAFIYLTMNDKLTEWYVTVFLAAWVIDRFTARKNSEALKGIQTKEQLNDTTK